MKITSLRFLVLAFCALAGPSSPSREADGPGPPDASTSLQAKYGGRFVVGVALGGKLPDDYSADEQKLIVDQFGSITPENCMKMTAIQPREGEFHFEQADALVAFAQKWKLQLCGHTLVWAKDERTPAWIFKDGDKPACANWCSRG